MTDLVFFYGTLMSGFKRPGRERLDSKLTPIGRGSIHAALFDVGLYPAAIPATDALVQGELHRMSDDTVLHDLDEIEGFRPEEPDASLYTRAGDTGHARRRPHGTAWTYFYNAPLGNAPRIESGDYLDYLRVKR